MWSTVTWLSAAETAGASGLPSNHKRSATHPHTSTLKCGPTTADSRNHVRTRSGRTAHNSEVLKLANKEAHTHTYIFFFPDSRHQDMSFFSLFPSASQPLPNRARSRRPNNTIGDKITLEWLQKFQEDFSFFKEQVDEECCSNYYDDGIPRAMGMVMMRDKRKAEAAKAAAEEAAEAAKTAAKTAEGAAAANTRDEGEHVFCHIMTVCGPLGGSSKSAKKEPEKQEKPAEEEEPAEEENEENEEEKEVADAMDDL